MRVKLSYTVEVEDTLKESSKLLSLKTESLQDVINLFNELVEMLAMTNLPVNITTYHEKMDKLRTQLAELDGRCEEITQIVEGYEQYRQEARVATATGDLAGLVEELKEVSLEENVDLQE